MDDAAARALSDELGGSLPEGLEQLDDDELGELADALRTARERQAAVLEQATDEALGHVPRLLRGPVRRILG